MEQVCCKNNAPEDTGYTTLAVLAPGCKGVIKDFVINCEDEKSCRFVRRLKEMGLHSGAHFEILRNTGNGEISLTCEGSTMCLGQGMADKIKVELASSPDMEKSLVGRFRHRLGMRPRP